MVYLRKRRRERRSTAVAPALAGLLLHQLLSQASAFCQLPTANTRGRPHAAPAAAPSSPPSLRRRQSSGICPGDHVTLRPMFNSILLLPSGSTTALAGSKLANAFFRSGGGGGATSAAGGSASYGGKVVPGMQHGLLEVLQPLLSFLVGLVQSMWPSPLERKLFARLLVAASVGMFIGTERRTSHRPAGVRTMSLVALGACTFTLVSQFGFVGKADQARVAASVASGVGFIGAGVITTSGKEASIRDSLSLRGRGSNRFPSDTTSTYNDVDGEVRGLTTASAIWITAGLGMACGAGLFFVATLGAVLTVGILKISEVITSLRKKWVRVRSILRPKLAQKLAEEAQAQEARLKAEKDGVVSGLGDEDHEEGHEEGEEEEEKERERREKEKKDKEEKEKREKERQEKERREKKEKEKERLVEAEALAGRGSAAAAAEVGGVPAPNDTTAMEDEDDEDDEEFDDDYDEEDYEPLYEIQPEDVEYEDDPFYGRPWDTEVPKVSVAADNESESEIPPLVFGPTRRRTLTRSRVLSSRKSRLNMSRTSGLNVPVRSSLNSPRSSSPPQPQPKAQRAAVSVPGTSAAGVAGSDAPARPVRTVGDLLLAEQRVVEKPEQQQQRRLAEQLQNIRPTSMKKQENSTSVSSPKPEDGGTTAVDVSAGAPPKKSSKSRRRRQDGGSISLDGIDGTGESDSGAGVGGGSEDKEGYKRKSKTPLKTTVKAKRDIRETSVPMKKSAATEGSSGRLAAAALVNSERQKEEREVAASRGVTASLGKTVGDAEGGGGAAASVERTDPVGGGSPLSRAQATAEARGRLADSLGDGVDLDGSPDTSV